jgi:CrcB protein
VLQQLLAVAVGGALGAMARYGIALWARQRFDGVFPWGTLLANALGCLLIGLLVQTLPRWSVPEAARLIILTGFLGALTTFSTFGWETVRAAQLGQPGLAVANVAANLTVGLLAVTAGIGLGRLLP